MQKKFKTAKATFHFDEDGVKSRTMNNLKPNISESEILALQEIAEALYGNPVSLVQITESFTYQK